MERLNPGDCPHRHVHRGERWFGSGKYIFWQCKDCDAYLRPLWQRVDAAGWPVGDEGGTTFGRLSAKDESK